MRTLRILLAWMAVFLLFVVLRFPYRAVFERTVAQVEAATGADLAWEDAEVGLLGVDLRGFSLHLPSGARFQADRARIRPAWRGLTASFTQTQAAGSASARLQGNALTFQAEKLQVQSGSRDLQTVRASGEMDYDLGNRQGQGEVRLALPELSGVLPMPIPSLEVGAKVSIKPVAGKEPGGTDVTSDINLFGEGISGKGRVNLHSLPGGGPPRLNGSLQIDAGQLGTHQVRVGGTWGRPEWSLAQGANP